MERWINSEHRYGENPKVDAFLAEVIKLSKKHGLSISHEDTHGGFQVEEFNEENAKWLLAASDQTSNK